MQEWKIQELKHMKSRPYTTLCVRMSHFNAISHRDT